jgi:hypothetical protein
MRERNLYDLVMESVGDGISFQDDMAESEYLILFWKA